MKKSFNLTYTCGLHARPSAALVQLVKGFDAEVTVVYNNGRAHADSIIDVLSLGVHSGEVSFEATGNDAEKVLEEIGKFIHKLNTDHNW
jgi:phosphotransferase system HPr (HPr) family protein